MSRVPVSWSMMPTTMNNAALKTAWANSSKLTATAASAVPAPATTNMKPSWLTVPKASSSLRSCWRSARKPPAIIVTRPTVNTVGRQKASDDAKAGDKRATRYTPAVTIVAECR